MITFVSGSAATISRVASMPLLPLVDVHHHHVGLWTRAFASASSAVPASPITSKRSLAAQSAFRPSRTTS